MVELQPWCQQARGTRNGFLSTVRSVTENVLDIKPSCHYISFLLSGQQHIKHFFFFSYDLGTIFTVEC